MCASRLAAVIEVQPDDRRQVPVDLVAAAYRASRAGTVVLVLNGLSPTQIDRALDSVVRQTPGVAGVEYCTPATLKGVLQRKGRPFVAAVRTSALARRLISKRVVLLPLDKAMRALADLHARGRLSSHVARAES